MVVVNNTMRTGVEISVLIQNVWVMYCNYVTATEVNLFTILFAPNLNRLSHIFAFLTGISISFTNQS